MYKVGVLAQWRLALSPTFVYSGANEFEHQTHILESERSS